MRFRVVGRSVDRRGRWLRVPSFAVCRRPRARRGAQARRLGGAPVRVRARRRPPAVGGGGDPSLSGGLTTVTVVTPPSVRACERARGRGAGIPGGRARRRTGTGA